VTFSPSRELLIRAAAERASWWETPETTSNEPPGSVDSEAAAKKAGLCKAGLGPSEGIGDSSDSEEESNLVERPRQFSAKRSHGDRITYIRYDSSRARQMPINVASRTKAASYHVRRIPIDSRPLDVHFVALEQPFRSQFSPGQGRVAMRLEGDYGISRIVIEESVNGYVLDVPG